MPANLPPQYHEVEKKFREAKSPGDKLPLLREMLAILPKHKGTEKLQADLKKRISKLQADLQKSKKTGRRPYGLTVEREGAGQVVLLGPPNSGKSSIIRALTRAEPEVAPYPFTTRRPMPGMMQFEDIQIQLVDTPAISEAEIQYWVVQLARNADAVMLVFDSASPTLLEDFELVEKQLAARGIRIGAARGGKVDVGTESGGGGDVPRCATLPDEADGGGTEDDAGGGKAGGDAAIVTKRSLVVGNKIDLTPDQDAIELLGELVTTTSRLATFSAFQASTADSLKRELFELLDLVRVYTKIPGKKPDKDRPFVLPVGSTVMDVAGLVHKDFVFSLRFARIWGSGEFDGQCVQRDHVVKDGDVLELHI